MTGDASDQHLRETPVGRETVFAGRLIAVHRDEVRLPDGRLAAREVVEHPGAVAIVAQLDDGRVLLVRQWRHAIGRTLWELPAGTRERGEEPALTAERELREETGYRGGHWRDLGQAPISPGYADERMYFFTATNLLSGEANTDGDENVDVEPFTSDQLATLVARAEVDVKTIAGLALAGLLPVPGG